jgi:predicted RND superfamily exporter protein
VTARPILGSASTTMIGWGSLLFAHMIGMQGIGKLATLGILCVAVASLIVLPAILSLLPPRAGAPVRPSSFRP